MASPSAAPFLRTPPRVAAWEGAWIAGVCLGAFALRLWNWFELRAHDPFFRLPAVDGRMYHEWAASIAAGDWMGDAVFLNGPLYPYLLAVVYAVFGTDPGVAKLAQVFLGTLGCGLTWLVGRRLFPPGVAVGAAALVAVSQMLIFYEGTLVVANAITLALLVTLLAVLRAAERPGTLRFVVAGASVGLGALARPNLLLLGALCGVWLWACLPDVARARRGKWLAAFAAAVLLAIAPVTLRNYAVGGDFVPITYAGGLNLFLGNNPDADGAFRVPRILPRSAADDPWEQRREFERLAELAEGRELQPSEVSAFWSGQAWRWVTERPGDAARLWLRKAKLSIGAFEPWNIQSIQVAREFSAVLRLPLLGFGWIAPLALAGVWLTARRWRELVPLYAALATVFATMLVFFVLARYRVPALPVLALFASAALAEAAAALRAKKARALVAPGIAALLFSVVSHADPPREDLSIAYYNLGNRYKALEDWPRAVESYERVLAARPNYISVHNNLALVHEARGETDLARQRWQHVLELAHAQGLARHIERAERHLESLGEP